MKRSLLIILIVSLFSINLGFVLPWIISNDTLSALWIVPLGLLDMALMGYLAFWLWKIAFKKKEN